MMFDGIPVYLEWSPQGKLFQVITLLQQPSWHFYNYDINWCDEQARYYVEENGPATSPFLLGNKYDRQGRIVPYWYWNAPCVDINFDQGTIQKHCIEVATPDILYLFFPKTQERIAFFETQKALAGNEFVPFSGSWMQAFLNAWALQQHVCNGRVVECPVCEKSFDYHTIHHCQHLHWCDLCNCWSIPPVFGPEDCSHRTPDGLYYLL